MNATSALEKFCEGLQRQGLVAVEVYLKRGRSRRFEIGPQGVLATRSEEQGWAVRASSARASLFAAGSGPPPARPAWPPADGYPLSLPSARTPEEWSEPGDIGAPLFVESEGLELLKGLVGELERELSGARVLRAVLEDGASSAEIASSLGVRAEIKGRAATLFVEAAVTDKKIVRVTDLVAEREPGRLNPREVGRRVADRLAVLSRGAVISRDRAPCVLAPRVVARVIGRLLPVFIGADRPRGASRADRGERPLSEQLTIVDDPRWHQGLLAASVDGEGVPTRRRVLVERGQWRESFNDWRVSDPDLKAPAGCMRRPTWREPPTTGPSHLYVLPDRERSVASLLAAMPRGYYFIEALPGLVVDVGGDRFRIPASGFCVRSGRVARPVSRAVLVGSLSSMLAGVEAVGRDLRFFLLGGMVGSPSWLVRSIEIGGD